MDATGGRRPRVAVVFGGRSSEHAISCSTAASVLRAIDRDRYDVVPIGIARDGRWVLAADDPERLEITAAGLPAVDATGDAVVLASDPGRTTLTSLAPGQVPRDLGAVDVVLPLLHGPFGEDGTLQGLLELADVRYVGSGVLASAAAMDKQFMKLVLAGSGLPVAPYAVVRPADWESDPAAAREAVASLGWPVFVKPARGGSSLGISRVEWPADLDAAVDLAREHDPKVIVEAAVAGREIECAVLGSADGGAPRTSRVGEIEILAGHEFYDFDAKYLDGEHVRLSCPADVPAHVEDEVRELSARAFDAFDCEGLARVDVFLTHQHHVLVNEINTMPGFTPTSMYPLLWAASGWDYPTLVDELLQLALARPTGLR